MRDIKNKICRDCDLITLLEDDTGMELLVNGKIISLDLPVAEVYRKVWEPTHPGEAMLVVYRMRGLLGDATEEFVQSFDSKEGQKADDEVVYRLAGVLADCGGLETLLQRYACLGTGVLADWGEGGWRRCCKGMCMCLGTGVLADCGGGWLETLLQRYVCLGTGFLS